MTEGGDSPAAVGDARFFRREGPFTLEALAAAIGGDVVVGGPALVGPFRGVAPLQAAAADLVSFLDNRRYTALLAGTGAGAVILDPALAAQAPPGCATLSTKAPYLAWARVAALFHPRPPARPGTHPTAIVDPTAEIDPACEIGPYCVIGARVRIGARGILGPFVAIGDGVEIGTDARIVAHCSVSHALLGDRVTLFPGVRIGQEGFGFAPTATGFVSVPQLGIVRLGDDVEVGANTTIDRGSAQDTVIGAGTRLDNLVQIGHNVRIGRCCVIVAQVGISGSTTVEDFVQIGGQAAFAGHLRIGKGARVGAKAGVMADVAAGASVLGSPAQPAREFFRQVALLKRLSARKRRDDGGHAGPPTEETGSG